MMLSYIARTDEEYSTGLRNCKTLSDLKLYAEHWHQMCPDAKMAIDQMDEAGFAEYKKGVAKERRGHYAGDEWAEKYGMILMPELLLRVGLIAVQFHAPFGTAWNRLEEVGAIKHNGVCFYWDDNYRKDKAESKA